MLFVLSPHHAARQKVNGAHTVKTGQKNEQADRMNITQADINKLCGSLTTKPAVSCPECQATVTSWHEEEFIGWFGHCADCAVQVAQDNAHGTNKV